MRPSLLCFAAAISWLSFQCHYLFSRLDPVSFSSDLISCQLISSNFILANVISSRLTSSHVVSSQSFFTSSHLISCLLSYFQLIPSLLSWCRLFFSLFASSQLFSSHLCYLNSSLFSSPQCLNSFQLSSSQLLIALLRLASAAFISFHVNSFLGAVEDVKKKLSCETSLKKWQLKLWNRCETSLNWKFKLWKRSFRARKVAAVKMKLSCETSWKLKMWKRSSRARLPSKCDSWSCENDEDVKTKPSCETSLINWMLKMWKRSFRARLAVRLLCCERLLWCETSLLWDFCAVWLLCCEISLLWNSVTRKYRLLNFLWSFHSDPYLPSFLAHRTSRWSSIKCNRSGWGAPCVDPLHPWIRYSWYWFPKNSPSMDFSLRK